ncbi:hypothetical protein HHK36_021590 [Tetracentron sinense]|uniref:Uncharacterized protein n=1 Tax=Tetracentron sinense TaxID=13715 RepID=A0A835DA30_TETSI|nr:hypothetical protein HHK36_021590 [Tetracentron sinense]
MSRERSRYLEAMVYESLEHWLVVAEASKTHMLCERNGGRVCFSGKSRRNLRPSGLAGERGNVEGEITLFGSHGERVSIGCFSGKFWRNSRRSRSVAAAWLEELSSVIPSPTTKEKKRSLLANVISSQFCMAFWELDMDDFMSGKTALRNIMSILLPGVNAIISDRTNQVYGQLLEKVVHLSLDIIILVLEKDLFLADYWRSLYQIGIPRFGFGENFDPGSYVVGVLESLSSKEKRTDKIITQNVEVHDLSANCAAPLAVLECYFLQAQGSLGLSVMGGPNFNLEELLEFEEENKLLFEEIEERRKIIGASPMDGKKGDSITCIKELKKVESNVVTGKVDVNVIIISSLLLLMTAFRLWL